MVAMRVDGTVVQRRRLDPDRVRVRGRPAAEDVDALGDGSDAVALLEPRMRDAAKLRPGLALRRDDREAREDVRAVAHVRDDALERADATDRDAALAARNAAAHLLEDREEAHVTLTAANLARVDVLNGHAAAADRRRGGRIGRRRRVAGDLERARFHLLRLDRDPVDGRRLDRDPAPP